jgi:hypothetical protein
MTHEDPEFLEIRFAEIRQYPVVDGVLGEDVNVLAESQLL